MTKRRLTNRQQTRQESRLTRRVDDISLKPEQHGLLVAHYGTTLIVENQAGKLYRCSLRQNLGTLVTGDKVIWAPTEASESRGVVLACLPRHSLLCRPDGTSSQQSSKPIVANIDQILIVAARSPLPKETTLDRYLVLAENFGIPAVLVFNKSDLPVLPEYEAYCERRAVYAKMGYPWIETSIQTQAGLDALKEQLRGRTSIFMGQSGVGKSSLLTQLIPEANIATQTLSRVQGQGRHTTTTTRLYHLPFGGDVIDSPGVNQFNLRHFSAAQVTQGFKEFQPFLGQCRFRNCEHRQDPACALQQAKAQGLIAPFRMDNYHQILSDSDQVKF